MRLECPVHGIVPREETVKGYEINKDEYVCFEPEELKALEQASSSAVVIDSFVPERAIDPGLLRGHVLPRRRQEWRVWISGAGPDARSDSNAPRSVDPSRFLSRLALKQGPQLVEEGPLPLATPLRRLLEAEPLTPVDLGELLPPPGAGRPVVMP